MGCATLHDVADWTPLRNALADVDTSVTFPWAELDALVGGLPRSAYVHNAFWKGARSGWPGFTTADVRVGQSVTFVPVDAPAPARPPTLPKPDRAIGGGSADVILVGCVKTKLAAPACARDLYVSPLFRKERAYAERAGVPWFILSAQHGLVAPEEVLEPYELRLSTTSRDYRHQWGRRVVRQLDDAIGPIEGRTIELHAGSAYTDAVRDVLRASGAEVVEPLAGLAFGPRLKWYGDGSAPSAATAPTPEVGELIRHLTHRDKAVSPAEFLATGAARFRSAGLYSWWVDAEGAAGLTAGLGQPVDQGLIYAGLAGATRSGDDSRKTPCGDGSSRCTSAAATSSRRSG